MLEDDWTKVTANDKKRVMRRSKIEQRPSSSSQHISKGSICVPQSSLLASDGNSCQDDILFNCITDCMNTIIGIDLFTNLCISLRHWVDIIVTDDLRIGKLVAYGVGNFSNTRTNYHSASLWQLALAICIQRKVNANKDFVIKIDFYDPCTTVEEQRFLHERFKNIDVLTINDRGNYTVDNTIGTVFLMPHCPAQLYENVIWSNYDKLDRIVIVGNSLRNLAERRSANQLLCLQTLVPNLHESPMVGSRIDHKKSTPLGNFVGAWNDTFVSFYNVRMQTVAPRPYDYINSNTADAELL